MTTGSDFQNEQILFQPAVPRDDAIRVIYAFPNEYSVGITSLGYQVIWSLFALREDVAVSRWFTDRHEALPTDPELLGFSVSWELDYVNILSTLEQFGIPLHSRDRQPEDPLIFGGGPVLTANPEPFADFFDVILLGDGEGLIDDFIAAFNAVRDQPKAVQYHHLAQVPGVYIPALYEPHYAGASDPLDAVTPIVEGIPLQVEKRTFRGKTLSTSTVVTAEAAWENIYMVEVVRSCPELCRFCLASYLTLPFRSADIEGHLIPAVERGLKATHRIGLLGASVTQHPQFNELLDYLAQDQFDPVRLSLASVRTGTVTPHLAHVLSRRGTRSITVAIESGSERIREVINKKLTNPEILRAASAAAAGGLKGIKFYGMVGIPTEQPEDLDATVDLMKTLKKQVPSLRYTLGCSTFVPKAQTPFQWQGVDKTADKKLKTLNKHLRSAGIDFRPESYNWSVIQALISRGDRRVGRILELAREFGDSLGSYKRAFKECRGQLPPLDYYVHDTWDANQTLPWTHLRAGLPVQTLLEHGSLDTSAISQL